MMEQISTAIPDVFVLKPKVFKDSRGFFTELYNKKTIAEMGLHFDFVQDNLARSSRGVLRGLHYQLEHCQGKMVTVLSGEVFDVAVDLRRSSPYFGKYVSVFLRADEFQSLWVPPGFGHGYLVLSETAEFFYKVTDYYHPQSERTLKWDDPQVGIQWPLKGMEPLLSAKDLNGKSLVEAEVYS